MNASLAERVCSTLEGLCLLEWTPKNEKLEDVVYKFCHLVRGTCENRHHDWMRQFLETEKEVNEAMDSPANKANPLRIRTASDGSWTPQI